MDPGVNRGFERAYYGGLPAVVGEEWWDFNAWEPLQDTLHHYCQEAGALQDFRYGGTYQFAKIKPAKSKPSAVHPSSNHPSPIYPPSPQAKNNETPHETHKSHAIIDELDALSLMVAGTSEMRTMQRLASLYPGLAQEELYPLCLSQGKFECPEAENRARVPRGVDWGRVEDKQGVLDWGGMMGEGKGMVDGEREDCSFGAERWRPGEDIGDGEEEEEEEEEFDVDALRGRTKGVSSEWYWEGSERGVREWRMPKEGNCKMAYLGDSD